MVVRARRSNESAQAPAVSRERSFASRRFFAARVSPASHTLGRAPAHRLQFPVGPVTRLALTALALLVVLPATTRSETIFYLDSDGVSASTLFSVEPSTGELTSLGALPVASYALAAPTDRILFMATLDGHLFQLDVASFALTDMGPTGLSNVVGLDTSGGDLYATDEASDMLYRIDLAPLTTTAIGQLHLAGGTPIALQGGDIAQDSAGGWYLWTNSTRQLFRFDLATLVAEPIAVSQDVGTLTGLAFARNLGALVGASGLPGGDATLFLIDPAGAQAPKAVQPCVSCPTPYPLRYGDLAVSRCLDLDGDGFSPAGGDCGPVDCNDGDPAVHPRATEVCNGQDDDCNGVIDDEPAASASCSSSCELEGICTAGACTTRPRTGFDAALCELDKLAPDAMCEGQVPARWKGIISDAVTRARKPMVLGQQRASRASRPKLVKRPLNAAYRRLSALYRRAMRASRHSSGLASTCLAAVGQQADQVRRVVVNAAP